MTPLADEMLPPEVVVDSLGNLSPVVLPVATLAEQNEASVRLCAEISEIERRDFPEGFPPVLARCISHYLAGPTVPPAEGAATWWAGARRQVMGMIERNRQQPSKGKPT
jgi:hypothetical protein